MKNILITGISRGLGCEIAKKILSGGNMVYGISRTLSEELKKLDGDFPGKLKLLQFDLSDTDGILKNIFKDFVGMGTPLHGYVNNAAIAYDDIATNIKMPPLLEMYKVNVFSPMIMAKYAIRNFILHNTKGSIVHISSISVHTGYKGLSMYASTKGAIEAFSKNISREWGIRGIRSNAVVAGFMETSMSASLTPEQKRKIFNRTSLKSQTSVESVAATVDFLLSDSAQSITGQNIFVDSGTI